MAIRVFNLCLNMNVICSGGSYGNGDYVSDVLVGL
jgi:hypothetical protein